MKHAKRLPVIAVIGGAIALMLGSCTTATPYQPMSRTAQTRGGYYEERLASDTWRVTFAGNTLTSRETVEGYLLYRAAELTIEQGRDWFEIVDRDMRHEVRREVTRDPFYDPWWGYPYWTPYWRYYDGRTGWRSWYPWSADPFWTRNVDVREVERFEASGEIVMHDGHPNGDGRRSFDAREVIRRLEPRIKRPKE